MNTSKEVTICCLCNSSELKNIVNLGKTALANNLAKNLKLSLYQEQYDLGLVYCQNCHHVQLNTEINSSILFDKYSYKTGVSRKMISHFQEFTDQLCKYSDRIRKKYNQIKILDIGSNDSILLDILKEKGFQTYGIEPALNLAKDSSHKVYHGYFNHTNSNIILEECGSFDVITANNVFAHTRSLQNFISNAYKLLKSNGIFSIEVQYLPKLLKNAYIDMIYHEHTSYHHLKPLIQLFNKNSFFINSASHINTHGGSMRVIFNKENKNKHLFQDFSLTSEFIRKDDIFDSEIHKHFKTFKNKIKTLKRDLNKKIKELINDKTVLYGYSAPAKTVTLLSLIDKDLIDRIMFIIEDNTLKHGHYIPNTKIPIIDKEKASELIRDKDSVCIVFAWNMFDEISNKIINDPLLNPKVLISPVPLPHIIKLEGNLRK